MAAQKYSVSSGAQAELFFDSIWFFNWNIKSFCREGIFLRNLYPWRAHFSLFDHYCLLSCTSFCPSYVWPTTNTTCTWPSVTRVTWAHDLLIADLGVKTVHQLTEISSQKPYQDPPTYRLPLLQWQDKRKLESVTISRCFLTMIVGKLLGNKSTYFNMRIAIEVWNKANEL